MLRRWTPPFSGANRSMTCAESPDSWRQFPIHSKMGLSGRPSSLRTASCYIDLIPLPPQPERSRKIRSAGAPHPRAVFPSVALVTVTSSPPEHDVSFAEYLRLHGEAVKQAATEPDREEPAGGRYSPVI